MQCCMYEGCSNSVDIVPEFLFNIVTLNILNRTVYCMPYSYDLLMVERSSSVTLSLRTRVE